MVLRLFALVCALTIISAISAAADEAAAEPVIEEAAIDVPSTAAAVDDIVRNEDVVAMVQAGLPESTVIAAISAIPVSFDISPTALIALTRAGVQPLIIEAMIGIESANRGSAAGASALPPAAAVAETGDDADASLSPEVLARLAALTEQMPAPVSAPAVATVADPAPPAENDNSHTPRAWVVAGDARTPFAPSISHVAFMQARQSGNALNTLQGIGERALAFANPALGLATGLGALFRSGDPTVTVVWALPGTSAPRRLESGTVIEFDFSAIPGVNPDLYQPVLVQLVATTDNFRLVGAARTRASTAGGMPTGAVIEEQLPLTRQQTARGRYTVTLESALPPGEYALVLRPVQAREQNRRRANAETSLGDLIGGQSGDILYVAWDFGIGSRP